MIVVVDYGSGNLRSVAKALETVGGEVLVSGDISALLAARYLVLPGVGAFANCYANLERSGLIAPILRHIADGKPFLGICVGMQLLFSEGREFGRHPGLGLIPGVVDGFPRDLPDPAVPGRLLKVPHMGWNRVRQERDHPLWRGIPDASHFYFVHSYHGQPLQAEQVAATSEYGVKFVAAVARDNIFATQFHPEKSQRHGLQLLRNFVAWRP